MTPDAVGSTEASADDPPATPPNPSRPAARRLLVLACSSRKRKDPGYIPARLRYDGPLWQTLRSIDPERRAASVGFVSARYGFNADDAPILDYDARLTPDLAAQMIAGGMGTRWPRPPSPRHPDNSGMHPGAEIASMASHGRRPFTSLALVGGADYLAVMRAFVEGFKRMGCVTQDAEVVEINGTIGYMRRDLARWLRDGLPPTDANGRT